MPPITSTSANVSRCVRVLHDLRRRHVLVGAAAPQQRVNDPVRDDDVGGQDAAGERTGEERVAELGLRAPSHDHRSRERGRREQDQPHRRRSPVDVLAQHHRRQRARQPAEQQQQRPGVLTHVVPEPIDRRHCEHGDAQRPERDPRGHERHARLAHPPADGGAGQRCQRHARDEQRLDGAQAHGATALEVEDADHDRGEQGARHRRRRQGHAPPHRPRGPRAHARARHRDQEGQDLATGAGMLVEQVSQREQRPQRRAQDREHEREGVAVRVRVRVRASAHRAGW
jgi:hypothetical protein